MKTNMDSNKFQLCWDGKEQRMAMLHCAPQLQHQLQGCTYTKGLNQQKSDKSESERLARPPKRAPIQLDSRNLACILDVIPGVTCALLDLLSGRPGLQTIQNKREAAQLVHQQSNKREAAPAAMGRKFSYLQDAVEARECSLSIADEARVPPMRMQLRWSRRASRAGAALTHAHVTPKGKRCSCTKRATLSGAQSLLIQP
jgi:hypothetical protein